MITLYQAQRLSLKKIGFNKGKSLFVIIPVSILFALLVVGASQAKNLISVAHNSIFSPIQGQNEIVEVNKNTNNPREMFANASTTYSSTDVSLIASINNVEKANLIYKLPLQNVQTIDLFSEKLITISSLAGLDAEYASLYTNNDFTYKEGEAIPIILNANDFYETLEDWNGKTEILVEYSKITDPALLDSVSAQTPIKTKAVSYKREELIGKEITITIGGLDTISDIKQESTTTGFKYVKKSDAEITAEHEARKVSLAKYYDYEKIATPLTYKFVIVGVSEGTDKTKAFVPAKFAQVLLKDYFSLALSARNKTIMPTTDMNATYAGLVYDGVSIQSDTTSSLFAGIRNQVNAQVGAQINDVNAQIDKQNSQISSANRNNNNVRINMENLKPGDRPVIGSFTTISSVSKLNAGNIKVSYTGMATSYNIPGLVFVKERTTSELTGEYSAFDFTQDVPLASTTILVKMNDLVNREQVVADLNSKGFTYQDFSQYKAFEKLEGYVALGLDVASLSFMVITALFILINMAKFVSEGRKEIGIFRALGATKGDIRKVFILQSLSYIVISLVLGAILGAIVVVATSGYMVTAAQGFVTTAIGNTVTLTGAISASDFLGFDLQLISLYAAGLVLITLLVSLIPSSQAAKVSPVEAIRNS